MTSNRNEERSFLLTRDFLTSVVSESERELAIIEQQIPYYLSEIPKNRYVISLLSELFSANYRLSREFKFHLKSGVSEKNDAGEECVCFAQEQFFIIQSLIMARHFITKDISSVTSISIFEN